MSDLTPHQVRLLQLLADGHTQTAIARQLDKSPHTVKGQMQTLFEALGVHSATHAVALAYRRGILAVDGGTGREGDA